MTTVRPHRVTQHLDLSGYYVTRQAWAETDPVHAHDRVKAVSNIERSQVQRDVRGAELTYTVLGSTPVPIVRWRWTFERYGTGTLLSLTWQLLEEDPVLGTSYAEIDQLRDTTAESMGDTLAALCAWAESNAAP